jgi:poly-gamma-glutamate capsule biosynthesis protein CapA/YwtB (metallophosphatase superfamily)
MLLKKFLWVTFILVISLSGCMNQPLPTLIVLPTNAAITDTPTASPIPDTPTPTDTPTQTPTETATPTGIVSLMAVGDIMLGRSVGDKISTQGPQVVLAGVRSVLDSADVIIGNLECALTNNDQAVDKAYTLKGTPESAAALEGFSLVSLANNHAMDFGYSGLLDTQAALLSQGIASVGAGINATEAHTPVFLERNGVRLAFLAYADVPKENGGFDASLWTATNTSPGIAWADPEQITADVSAAKSQADVVIVLLHAGYEVDAYIHPVTPQQQSLAHAAIDAGAALVIGSHPHVLQRIEQYHGGLIAYSLGNFVFDEWLGLVNDSVILHVTLTRQGFQGYDYTPVFIVKGLPTPASQDEATRIASLLGLR